MALTPEEQAELEALEQDTELQDYLSNLNKPKAPKVETGFLESAARGFGQGLLSEHADELTASLESTLTGKPEEQALEESRAEYKASQEQYPITSAIGGIAGGVAQGLGISALPGGLAAAGAPKLASAALKLKSLLIPTTGASALKNIATAATTGAIAGGLTEIGASEEKGLERLQEVPRALITGGVLGGGLGTLAEGVGYAGREMGKSISKSIDEGKFPDIFKQVRSSWRSSKADKGLIATGEKKKAYDEAYDFAENEIRPELQNAVNEASDLKRTILTAVDTPISLTPNFVKLNDTLKGIGSKSEKTLRKDIAQLYTTKLESLKSAGKQMGLSDADQLASDLTELVMKEEYSGVNKAAKKAVWKFINNLKSTIRYSVKPEDAVRSLSDNPQALQQYSKYISKLSKDEMLDLFMKGNGTQFNAKEALSKAKDIRDIFKVMTQAFASEDPTVVTDLIKQPAVKEALIQTNPIQKLDEVVHKILSASEIMGGVTNAKSYDQAGSIDEVVKIFKNILSQTKDSDQAYLDEKIFTAFMKNLKETVPETAEKINQKIAPIKDQIDLIRYTEGGNINQGTRGPGPLKGLIGNIGQYGVMGINVTGRMAKAAGEGKAGPLPGASLFRPAVASLSTMDEMLQKRLIEQPNSTTYKTFSKMIKDALSEKNETRRAAILNTLMQYKTFREMFKEEE